MFLQIFGGNKIVQNFPKIAIRPISQVSLFAADYPFRSGDLRSRCSPFLEEHGKLQFYQRREICSMDALAVLV